MAILFVSHSMGDTNAVLATTRNLLKKPHDKLYLLAIGQVATNTLRGLPETDPVRQAVATQDVEIIYLKDILNQEITAKMDDNPLTNEQLLKIQNYLQPLQIKKALIGTPSKANAGAAFQLAEMLAQQLNPDSAIIYNDYLFHEPSHIFYRAAAENNSWQNHYSWFVPLPKAKQRLTQMNPGLQIEAVGHIEFDKKESTTEPSALNQSRRYALQINPTHSLIFISGTKELKDDYQVIEAMLETLNSGYYKTTSICVGIHPGLADPAALIQKIAEFTEKYPNTASCIKLVVSKALQEKLTADDLLHPFIVKVDFTGNDLANAADAVACAVPATLCTSAAKLGKPAYTHDAERKSDLPEDRLFCGKKRLPNFYAEATQKIRKTALTKKDLQLINGADELEEFAEILAKRFTK